MPVTEPSTPAPFDDEDMEMQDDTTEDAQTTPLKGKLEGLKLVPEAVAASEPTVRCEDLLDELRTIKLRLSYGEVKYRELGGRYTKLPTWVREHRALSLHHQAACSAAFGAGRGETVTDVVLEAVSTIIQAAETGLRNSDGVSAQSDLQVAEELLVQVSGTLKRLEGGVVEHERLWGRK